MPVLFDDISVEALADGAAVTSPGPFSSVGETNGTVRASSTQAASGSRSIKFACNSAGTNYHGVAASLTVPTNYETIVTSFAIYIDTIASTGTILTLAFLTNRYCVYLFNSSGWKIGLTIQHNSTNAKTGSEATSAAMTTGAWHRVTAIYKKVGAAVDLILRVDDVQTSTGSQTPANYTQIASGANTWRIGPSQLPTYDVNATSGDIFYMDNVTIHAFAANASNSPATIVADGPSRGNLVGVNTLRVG